MATVHRPPRRRSPWPTAMRAARRRPSMPPSCRHGPPPLAREADDAAGRERRSRPALRRPPRRRPTGRCARRRCAVAARSMDSVPLDASTAYQFNDYLLMASEVHLAAGDLRAAAHYADRLADAGLLPRAGPPRPSPGGSRSMRWPATSRRRRRAASASSRPGSAPVGPSRALSTSPPTRWPWCTGCSVTSRAAARWIDITAHARAGPGSAWRAASPAGRRPSTRCVALDRGRPDLALARLSADIDDRRCGALRRPRVLAALVRRTLGRSGRARRSPRRRRPPPPQRRRHPGEPDRHRDRPPLPRPRPRRHRVARRPRPDVRRAWLRLPTSPAPRRSPSSTGLPEPAKPSRRRPGHVDDLRTRPSAWCRTTLVGSPSPFSVGRTPEPGP